MSQRHPHRECESNAVDPAPSAEAGKAPGFELRGSGRVGVYPDRFSLSKGGDLNIKLGADEARGRISPDLDVADLGHR